MSQEEVEQGAEDDVAMSFMEHLEELRKRLIYSFLGILPGMSVAWWYKEEILSLLVRPLAQAWRRLGLGEVSLHFANPVDPFVSYLKIAAVVGALFSSPWIFWQIWAFISPGLYRRERRYALPFVIASTLFFAGGAVFSYHFVFPLGFETLLGFAGMLPDQSMRIQPTLMIGEYLSFALRMLVAFGVVFEVPVVVTFLAAIGVVNWKQLLRFGRWWLVIAAVLAGILTPPDVGSQMMMMVPLVGLYFLSVGLAYFIGPKPPKEGPASSAIEPS